MSILSSADSGKVKMKKQHKEDSMSETENAEGQEQKPRPSAKLQQYLDQQNDLLKINDVDLNDDFIVQPQRYFKAAMNFHKAEKQLQLEKLALEDLIAKKDSELRSSGEKTTEAYIDKAIKGDEGVQLQKRRIAEAELQVGLHQACMRAWEHKRDMLIQVGAVQRAEMSGQVQINKNGPDQERPKVKNGRATEL